MKTPRILGLVAAVHSPFDASGALRLDTVEKQAEHLLSNGVGAAFVCGTTGESSSLTLDERMALAAHWVNVTRGSALKTIVHVGHTCVADAAALAAHAEKSGAFACAALAPTFFKPPAQDELVETMRAIASGAPRLPFYYYEFPAQSGLTLSPSEFLESARARIPNLAGIKFTSVNLMEYQLCRAAGGGCFDALFGCDEILLGALALGAQGAVGSTYNFAAPVYLRLMAAYRAGDFESARLEQLNAVRLIQTLARHGYMASAKFLMRLQGVDVGEPRLPNRKLNAAQQAELETKLEAFALQKSH